MSTNQQLIFLQKRPDIDSTMAENRTINLSIESLLGIRYGTSHHQQEGVVDTLILCNATFYLITFRITIFYFFLINFFGQYFLLRIVSPPVTILLLDYSFKQLSTPLPAALRKARSTVFKIL